MTKPGIDAVKQMSLPLLVRHASSSLEVINSTSPIHDGDDIQSCIGRMVRWDGVARFFLDIMPVLILARDRGRLSLDLDTLRTFSDVEEVRRMLPSGKFPATYDRLFWEVGKNSGRLKQDVMVPAQSAIVDRVCEVVAHVGNMALAPDGRAANRASVYRVVSVAGPEGHNSVRKALMALGRTEPNQIISDITVLAGRMSDMLGARRILSSLPGITQVDEEEVLHLDMALSANNGGTIRAALQAAAAAAERLIPTEAPSPPLFQGRGK